MEAIAVRARPYLSVYLILIQADRVCLLLRKNTGFCDGKWGLISGHAETGEPATTAMIREAQEEAGITPLDLRVTHISHTKTDREGLNIFFKATQWEGDLKNMEPEKCDGLEFFPIDQLPSNTIRYIKSVLENTEANITYDENGWKSPVEL